MPWISAEHRHSDTSYRIEASGGRWEVHAEWWGFDRTGSKEFYSEIFSSHATEADALDAKAEYEKVQP